MAKDKKQVAWLVRENCEGHCTIVFHHHGMAAKREGAGELDADIESCEVERASEFDQYAEAGVVPVKVLVEHGWWFECLHCGKRIEEDNESVDINDVQEIGPYKATCSYMCKRGRELEIKNRNQRFEWFKNAVQEKRPDLEFVKFSGGWPALTFIAEFTFPGAKYHGQVRAEFDKDNPWWWREGKWTVCTADEDAWNQYTANRLNKANSEVTT